MEHDYSLFIENLKGRRYDEALRESVLTDAFMESSYPDCVKYTLESMMEIDPAYAYKVYANTRRIHEKLEKGLNKRKIDVEYRYQGALKTYSNIVLYGEVEIIVIKKNLSPKPHHDVRMLAMELMDILSGDRNFKSVDYSNKTRIRITATKPTCEIDVLPSIWVNSKEFIKTKNEIYRGIAEFDFINKKVKKYLPFLNIARLNSKDQRTKGNFKALCRLVQSIKADTDEKIDLRESEISGMLYIIPDEYLQVDRKKQLSIVPYASKVLSRVANDPTYFAKLRSPSEKDILFAGRPEKRKEVQKLSMAFNRLIFDVNRALNEMDMTMQSNVDYELF